MNAESAYLFRHAVVREAAYELQLPSDREQLHAVTAELLQEQHRDSLDAAAAEIARHLRLGGAGSEQERPFVRRGADHAQKNFDHDTTIEMLERLLEIGNEADQQAARQLLYGWYLRFRNDSVRARHHALGLLRMGRSSGKAGLVSRALSLIATTRSDARAIRLNRRAYRIAAKAQSWLPAGLALGNLGLRLLKIDERKSERVLRRAIVLNEKAANHAGVGYFKGSLAGVLLKKGCMNEARRLAQQAVTILEAIKAMQYLPLAYSKYAHVLSELGRFEEADRILRRGIKTAMETGIARDVGALLYERACLCLRRGQHEEAAESWHRAQTLLSEAGYAEDLEDQRQALQRLCEELGVPMPE